MFQRVAEFSCSAKTGHEGEEGVKDMTNWEKIDEFFLAAPHSSHPSTHRVCEFLRSLKNHGKKWKIAVRNQRRVSQKVNSQKFEMVCSRRFNWIANFHFFGMRNKCAIGAASNQQAIAFAASRFRQMKWKRMGDNFFEESTFLAKIAANGIPHLVMRLRRQRRKAKRNGWY